MTRQKLTVGLVAAAFTLSMTPVWADQSGSRPNNTGSSSGSAVPRGGGSGSSGGGSGGSTAGSSGSSGSSSSWGSPSRSGGAARERAPQRPTAVPRGSGGSEATAAGRPSGSSATVGRSGQGRTRNAVPSYSRPRDSRNATGTAVERQNAPGGGGGRDIIYYPYDPFYSFYYGSYYSRYGYSPYYGFPGYGLGFGYFGYDPYLYGGGYSYPSYGAGGYSSQYREVGNLRLKVKPSHAQVYVDGYYVGVVDSFDGVFQKLGIEAGAHRIELRAEGYETVQFEVLVTPGETVTYKGEMQPQRP